MEGTLEDSPVKDLSQDASDAVLIKDPIIPNGMNGDYDIEAEDELGADDLEEFSGDKAEEDLLLQEPEDEVTDGAGDTNSKDVNKTDVLESMEVDSEDVENEAEDTISDGEKDAPKVLDNLSAANNVSEVSKETEQCKVVDAVESMDVDAQSNNSDVECLDEGDGITELDSEVEESTSQSKSAEKKTSDDADVQQLNDSSEVEQINDSAEIIDSSLDTSDVKICEENGSCGSPDIEEITDGAKSNGHDDGDVDGDGDDDDEVSKGTPKKKNRKQVDLSNITPRRSSRNIKRTSYIEKEQEEEEVDDEEVGDDSSDIEEIKQEDPLAGIDGKDKENSKSKSSLKNVISNKTTIVVNDTKRLVEIAAGSKVMNKGGKKEPTLVIIDTNSILSGRGGVPLGSSPKTSTNLSQQQAQHQSHHQSHQQHHPSISTSSSFSMVPMGMNPQAMYPGMRTTITPVPMSSRGAPMSPKSTTITALNAAAPPQILPTLTDDMFVVEAPSFIVPYVYEKPPLTPLKEFVGKLQKGIAEVEKMEKEEKLKKLAEKAKKKAESDEKAEDDEKMDEDAADDASSEKDKGTESETETSDKGDGKTDTIDLTEKGGTYDDKPDVIMEEKTTGNTYFDLPLGKFFMNIGMNLVQEYVQTDLLRTQKRKQKGGTSVETQMAINSLIKNLEFSKENNEPFHLEMKKCEFCSFKTESALVMQHHLETPHMRNYVYKCNFCPIEVRSPHDILFHMEAEHNTRGRLERGPAFHQCSNCPFEDNQKGKLSRHILTCTKKFRPERNLEPSADWEPPAKIPRIIRPRTVGPANAASALAMAMSQNKGSQPLLPKLLPAPIPGRGRGRPPMQPRYADMKSMRPGSASMRQDNVAGMMYRPTTSGLLVPTPYQFGSNQLFQVMGGPGTVISSLSGVSSSSGGSSVRPAPTALLPNVNDSLSRLSSSQNTSVTSSSKNPTAKLLSQPSISITPLPRTTPQTPVPGSVNSSKPGGKNTFVICEICDGYIKDLEQLRNHMQWIHKVKIHPKMIYNRPPLNCQKCQFRFFTDQGLERHLLGSHGLVTSSMQEAANKGKDAGRCPACGRVYQWKLLNHVARDHNMTLKPAHLSYKCTVCTATFGMYKQFENHVYSAHSVVAKRVMDKKSTPSSPSQRSNDSLLKPLKINDEITIIPQPAKPTTRSGNSQGRSK